MKKIKKISYPSKYKELIDKYGDEEGNQLYYKFIRGASLEKYILKFGEEEGKKKYDEYKIKQKNSGVTLEKMIQKYGKEKGDIKYKKWKLNTRQDIEGFIMRYGEEKGRKKYEEFKIKSLNALKKVDHKNKLSIRKLNYWLKECNGVEELAKKKLKEYQNKCSLSKFILRYGENEGKKKYVESSAKHAITLERMINLYGEVDGKEKYENWKSSNVNSSKKYIKKYGKKRYEELLIKKLKNNKGYSNIGLEFCLDVLKNLQQEYKKLYYGDDEYMFFVFEDGINVIMPDLYIKDINLVIEFYGDFWHKNPKLYEIDQEFVKETWENDEKRIRKLKERYNANVIIIWESEYKQNKESVINNVIEKINDIYGNS